VIGAGPHGLAAVAHLRDAGVPTVAFGDALAFWRDTMPGGMWLRSSPRASIISDPAGDLSLTRWSEQQDREIGQLIALGDFIDYGRWFQSHAVPDLDARPVVSVQRDGSAFSVTLADGEELAAGRVVVAAGLSPFAHVPGVYAGLSGKLLSHTSATPPMQALAGRSVAVIGAGQSALESAALICEAGAQVEVIARARGIYWLGNWINDETRPVAIEQRQYTDWRHRHGLYMRSAPTELGLGVQSWIGAAPDVMRHVPRRWRAPLTYRCVRPAGAYWLPDRLREVAFALGRSVLVAQEHDGRARLRLDDGSERLVDHVLLGTGYRIDVRRYPFLAPELAAELRTSGGSPVLGRGLESSVPGLHFVGAPATESFGPAMRFVVGTAYTGPALTRGISGRRVPAFRWAF
jgi:cation diffusion facilitator CzcD-associated flavoprotein CzcO